MTEYLTSLYKTRSHLVAAQAQLTEAYRYGNAEQKTAVNMLLVSINRDIQTLNSVIPMTFKPEC